MQNNCIQSYKKRRAFVQNNKNNKYQLKSNGADNFIILITTTPTIAAQ